MDLRWVSGGKGVTLAKAGRDVVARITEDGPRSTPALPFGYDTLFATAVRPANGAAKTLEAAKAAVEAAWKEKA